MLQAFEVCVFSSTRCGVSHISHEPRARARREMAGEKRDTLQRSWRAKKRVECRIAGLPDRKRRASEMKTSPSAKRRPPRWRCELMLMKMVMGIWGPPGTMSTITAEAARSVCLCAAKAASSIDGGYSLDKRANILGNRQDESGCWLFARLVVCD